MSEETKIYNDVIGRKVAEVSVNEGYGRLDRVQFELTQDSNWDEPPYTATWAMFHRQDCCDDPLSQWGRGVGKYHQSTERTGG